MTATPEISLLKGRRIVLGVTGSIAAYKAADLASKLTQAGAQVDVVLTDAAMRFISPLTFQAVTGRRAFTEQDLWNEYVLHIRLGREADAILIAPATATTIARLAHGSGDTLISLLTLASNCPLLIAPAMDAGMYEHQSTRANIQLLEERGARILGPAEGRMASGEVGRGRMLEPHLLLGHLRLALGDGGRLGGRKVVVTAGGTWEPIDPVRVIANRSSGKQGFAVAQAALDMGGDVLLIAAPTALEAPIGAELISVNTALEMRDAVLQATADADVLVMAAAVADFRPAFTQPEKIKRRKGIPVVKLEATDDILALVAERRKATKTPEVLVGFAAESEDLLTHAQKKLAEKDLSMIVANDISQVDAGFGVDTNQVLMIRPSDQVESLPLLSKTAVAEVVMARVAELLEAGNGHESREN
ncbi:MAG: bifunctional phosphopantothenoylcysteine decarboxylase/phosphopantothenate--cysteine ligase CoaBC [Anaerolineales bacterium]|nr:bifunctional phosphopantothenoylcysteine decarboxylase/phosphopantothenate--cysteine ligase CoaBC [Anaerolineales bacterium]